MALAIGSINPDPNLDNQDRSILATGQLIGLSEQLLDCDASNMHCSDGTPKFCKERVKFEWK